MATYDATMTIKSAWQPKMNRTLMIGMALSLAVHGLGLGAMTRWGHFSTAAYLVCPEDCPVTTARINVALKEPPPPPPPPPTEPKEPEPPAVVAERPRPEEPPAAPRAGRVVLPDEAFAHRQSRDSDIRLDRPSLPEEVVVRESEAKAPVIVSGEIFGRTRELTPGAPGVFGLGGTGTAVGVGEFGRDGDGSGEGRRAAPAPAPEPAPQPETPPAPRGPSRPPQVLNWTDPPYPDQARQQGIEGTVTLRVEVGADGRPREVSVARSSGHRGLDEAAVTHVRRARFSPALQDGEPVAMAISFRVRFRLVSA